MTGTLILISLSILRGGLRALAWLCLLILYLIPVRFGKRRATQGCWLVNRRDRESGVVLMGDLIENIRDSAIRFFRRAPDNAMLVRHWGADSYITPGSASGRRSSRSQCNETGEA